MAFIRSGSGGSKQQELVSRGNVTSAGSSVLVKITTGFKPKMVMILASGTSTLFYDEQFSTTNFYKDSTSTSLGQRINHMLYSIDNDGFTYSSRSGTGTNMPYVARG